MKPKFMMRMKLHRFNKSLQITFGSYENFIRGQRAATTLLFDFLPLSNLSHETLIRGENIACYLNLSVYFFQCATSFRPMINRILTE